MRFFLSAEELLPVNSRRAPRRPRTVIEPVDKFRRLHFLPFWRDIAIAQHIGCHLGDRGVGARILETDVPRYGQSGESVGVNGGTQTERSELPVQLGIEHPA